MAEDVGRGGTWAARALGLVLGLIGIVLTLGGLWLAVLGGSLYYLIAGLGLMRSEEHTSELQSH